MKPANIAITPETIKEIVKMLEKILADENILYVKLKSFHWNMLDKNFQEYHKFFDELAKDTSEKIDEIAERIRALGEFVNGNMATYLNNTQLQEDIAIKKSVSEMLSELLEDYETQIRTLREFVDKTEALGDMGTTDFLTGILIEKEKTAWMVRSTRT